MDCAVVVTCGSMRDEEVGEAVPPSPADGMHSSGTSFLRKDATIMSTVAELTSDKRVCRAAGRVLPRTREKTPVSTTAARLAVPAMTEYRLVAGSFMLTGLVPSVRVVVDEMPIDCVEDAEVVRGN